MQCFICERPIQTDDVAVHDATIWQTHGNYGSRAYDPAVDSKHLEVAICDDCLVTRKHLVEEVVTVHRIEEISRRPPELP